MVKGSVDCQLLVTRWQHFCGQFPENNNWKWILNNECDLRLNLVPCQLLGIENWQTHGSACVLQNSKLERETKTQFKMRAIWPGTYQVTTFYFPRLPDKTTGQSDLDWWETFKSNPLLVLLPGFQKGRNQFWPTKGILRCRKNVKNRDKLIAFHSI
jgi:hypothetical protein